MRVPLFALAFAGMSCTLIGGESAPGYPAAAGYRSHPLTIDEAVQLALKQDPSILQQVQQLKVERGLFYQAQAKLLPQLTAASSYSQIDSALSPSTSSGTTSVNLLGVPSGSTLAVNSFGSGPPHNNA